MQTEQRSRPGRGRRTGGGQSPAEKQGSRTRANSVRKPEELNDLISTQQKGKQAGNVEIREKEDADPGGETLTFISSGATGRRREREQNGTGRRAASEGRDSLRRRVNQLEKEKLELASRHNQELCRLEAETTRLRSSVERGEAQREELQYQLTVSQRDADRAAELSRDKQELTERAAELQQTLQELQRALDITRRAREEDQHALQQDVEERDKLIQSYDSENQRLHRLLQDQKEALEELERRIADVQKTKEREADVNRKQAEELKYLSEREEKCRREKELLDQRLKSLESSIEAERSTHLESKFASELLQLRVQDLEALVAAERSHQQEALSSLELLRAKFGEVEKAYTVEKERSAGTELALQRLQTEYEQNKCKHNVALETERKATSDLAERLQEEQRQVTATRSLLEQAVKSQRDAEEAFGNFLAKIRETLRQHRDTGAARHSERKRPQGSGGKLGGPAKHDGSHSPTAEVLHLLKTTLCTYQHRAEETQKQAQDLLLASERLHEDNQSLRQMTSGQSRQIQESKQELVKLKEELTRLRHKGSDWSTQIHELQKDREARKRESEREREERERERDERRAEVQELTGRYDREAKVRLSFLYRLYQRLLAGCVLLHQPQSILGDFTWDELCDVISEQVDQLTSDLQKANDKISRLQSVCEKKSVCVRELQRNQEAALTRLQQSVRRREEAWSSQHTHTVTQLQHELQVCRSQRDTLQDHVSSLGHQCASLTSDLSGLQGLLSRSRKESACFFLASALLAGALKDTRRRLRALSEQKGLLARQLAGMELLEEEVQRLADALGGDTEEREAGRRAARRRWRSSVCVVLAARRWCSLAKTTEVLFRLDGGGASVCVCGDASTGQKGQSQAEGRDGLCARWLSSEPLASAVLSSMADLQGALALSGSSPVDVASAARSGLSLLLDKLHGQAEEATGRIKEEPLGLKVLQPRMKALVSSLQQHFLLFSQRLHSAEVERRSLRLEVAALKKGPSLGRTDGSGTVPAHRFHSVCDELRQALSREQEAQALIQHHRRQHGSEETSTLSLTSQALSEARREVNRKERSLRILGKHLSEARNEKKRLEQKLQQSEDELRDASRRNHCLLSSMKAAETSYHEVRDRLVQSERSACDQPCPLPLRRIPEEMKGAESIMGTAEAAACQSLLSTISQLFHTCSSRTDWLEQQVSAHRGHATALQDACVRDNQAFVPVELGGMETLPSAPCSGLSDKPTAAPKPSLSHSPPAAVKAKKATKKSRGRRR